MGMSDDLKINFDNNPFDTISKIAKDIYDRQDKEIALEFTKRIGELLKKNGVAPMIDEYRHETVKENSIEYRYGSAITGLDFTEHDKRFRDEINQLKYELDKKSSFETDRLVKLPFDAMETANMLINATYKDDMPFLEKKYDRNLYNIDDLEQIAEHLLVYCKHHREDEE